LIFQLRDEHLQAMGQVAEDNFVQRAVAHLRTEFPETTKPKSDRALAARVRRGRDRAAGYGLRSQKQVMWFLDAGMILGEKFDTGKDHPWARRILLDPRKSADYRARTVLETAVEKWHASRGHSLEP
jgi:hypothetical protein